MKIIWLAGKTNSLKTGFTDLSGGNLTVIFDKGVGDTFVAVVLGSSYKGRFDDMQKLVSIVTKY